MKNKLEKYEPCGSCECANCCDHCVYQMLMDFKEKYKWHDLRKNPEDLPEENKYVHAWVHTYKKVMDEYIIAKKDVYRVRRKAETWKGTGVQINTGMYNHQQIIAWREIEPFEEDNSGIRND